MKNFRLGAEAAALSSPSELQSPKRAPLSIEHVPLDRLQPDPGNARQHSAKQIRQIATSIETFGFNVPILVDADLNVIAATAGCSPAGAWAGSRFRPSVSIISRQSSGEPS